MRNPLSTALWSAELLAKLSPEDRAGARGEKLISMSLRALHRLRFLVEDHFLAERLDAGGIALRPEAVSIQDAIDSVAGKAHVVGLTAEVSAGEVWADRGVLERLLDALLAVAGRDKAPVRVSTERHGDAWVIRVAGTPPPPGAFEIPQKGTASDQTGRALALHMGLRAAHTLGGTLQVSDGAYLLRLPVALSGPGVDSGT